MSFKTSGIKPLTKTFPSQVHQFDCAKNYGSREVFECAKEEGIQSLVRTLESMRGAAKDGDPKKFRYLLKKAGGIRRDIASKTKTIGAEEFGAERNSSAKVTKLYDTRYVETNDKIKRLALLSIKNIPDKTRGMRDTKGDFRYTYRLHTVKSCKEKLDSGKEGLDRVDLETSIQVFEDFKREQLPYLNRGKPPEESHYIYSGVTEIKVNGEWRVTTRHFSVIPHNRSGEIEEEEYKLHGFAAILHTSYQDFQLHEDSMVGILDQILDVYTPKTAVKKLMGQFEYRLHHLSYFTRGNDVINEMIIEALRRVIDSTYIPRGHLEALAQPYFSNYFATYVDLCCKEGKKSAELYGNTQNYSEKKRNAVDEVAKTIKEMRGSSRGERPNLQTVLAQAGDLRHRIAVEANSLDAELFGVLQDRKKADIALHSFLKIEGYRAANAWVKELVLKCFLIAKERGKWYHITKGNSRYSFKITTNEQELLTTPFENMKILPDTSEEEVRTGKHGSTVEYASMFDRVKAYKSELRPEVDRLLGRAPREHKFIDPTVLSFIGRIEHKVDGAWRPLTRHMAHIPCDSSGKVRKSHLSEFQLHGIPCIVHTYPVDYFLHDDHMEALFARLLDENTPYKQLEALMGELEYFLHHLCYYKRGSAAITEIIVEALKSTVCPTYQPKGNLQALVEPFLSDYMKGFKAAEKAPYNTVLSQPTVAPYDVLYHKLIPSPLQSVMYLFCEVLLNEVITSLNTGSKGEFPIQRFLPNVRTELQRRGFRDEDIERACKLYTAETPTISVEYDLSDEKQKQVWSIVEAVRMKNAIVTYFGGMFTGPVTLSESEMEGLPTERIPLELFSCSQYALAKVGEKRLFHTLTKRNQFTSLVHSLLMNGWESVREPQKGDLVLYIKEREVMHVGFSIGDEWIESKGSVVNPFVARYPINVGLQIYDTDALVYLSKIN